MARYSLLLPLLLAACSRTAIPGGGDLAGADLASGFADLTGGPEDLAGGVADLAGFCGNPSSPRAELNGMVAVSPFVTARPIILNCCDSAAIDFLSMQLSTLLSLSWRHQVGQGPNPPVTLDLANLPAGWNVLLQSGCSMADGNCKPSDSLDTGLSGTLTISANHEMSLCLTAVENTPRPVLHSVRLWTPPTVAK